MIIGARIIKTGIAVTITMVICKVMGFEPAFFGAVAAVVNMQPSIFLTVKSAKDQLMVHIVGVATALVMGYLVGGNAITMGLITILLIVLYKRLGLQSGISMGVVAAVFVLGSSPGEFLPHALSRTAVIFTGMGTAMLVNICLFPPSYGRKFKEKLRESNEEAVRYFCQAVGDYVRLENEEPCVDQGQRAMVHKLNGEVRELAEFLRREGDLFTPGSSEQSEWYALAEKFMEYNEALMEKADRIYDLLPPRYERRLRLGNPPIGEEFKRTLDILESGCTTVSRVNGKLRSVIIGEIYAQPEKISEEYWERLSKAIEEWQLAPTSSYYVHALIEVGVMASEIKWASRQAKKLLFESIAGYRGAA